MADLVRAMEESMELVGKGEVGRDGGELGGDSGVMGNGVFVTKHEVLMLRRRMGGGGVVCEEV